MSGTEKNIFEPLYDILIYRACEEVLINKSTHPNIQRFKNVKKSTHPNIQIFKNV